MKKSTAVVCLVFAAVFILNSGCFAKDTPSPLRVGYHTVDDSVPFLVAAQEKLYEEKGVQVELVPFASALERDAALTAGAVDGSLSDPVSSLLLDNGRGTIKITSVCLGQKPEEGVYSILTSPKSKIDSVVQLKNVPIAVSHATFIEFVTDRMLEDAGFAPDEIKIVDVKKIPVRLQMLMTGAVEAATLPEPLSSIAESQGAKRLLADSSAAKSLSQTVIIFRTETLQKRLPDVQRFFAAYGQAVRNINADPEKYRSVFVKNGRVPADLAESYRLSTYPEPVPFSPEQFQPVLKWLQEQQLVGDLSYDELVFRDFLDPAL